jgi:hypothetical protein
VTRVYVYCEGQTEETFVRDVLGPHLWSFNVLATAILASTKIGKTGRRFKGGINSYERVKRDIQRLLRDRDARAVTTMIDFYGLPEEFPGMASRPAGSCYDRVAHIEREFGADISNSRLIPYLSLHEFEALLFVAPAITAAVIEGPGSQSAPRLAAIMGAFECPEEIDEGPDTAPSKRILLSMRGYRKGLHGPLITSRVGLDGIRHSCPHFDQWLSQLERLG